MSKPSVEQIAQWNTEADDIYDNVAEQSPRSSFGSGYLAARHKAYEEYSKLLEEHKIDHEDLHDIYLICNINDSEEATKLLEETFNISLKEPRKP